MRAGVSVSVRMDVVYVWSVRVGVGETAVIQCAEKTLDTYVKHWFIQTR